MISTSVPIEAGLDFILSHLEKPHFPRRISTFLTEKNGPWQALVNSRDEALAKFKESNLLNCRISAYRYPVPTVRGINAQEPNFFLSDLDRKNFKTNKSFNQCLESTLQNFRDKLHDANPTVLWSGYGYHILQPLDADVILEMESIFSQFYEPSRGFMRYAEKLMTDNKADSVHSSTVSFSNCMIRIPGSYNAKYVKFSDKDEIVEIPSQSEVKIVQRWDGYKPNIKWLLRDYWMYLIQERNNETLKRLQDERKGLRFETKCPNNRASGIQQINRIDWIESLYAKSLEDFRKYCVTFIFTPYFVNVRKVSQSEAFNLVMNWLDRCGSECRRLDFNARQKIKESLHGVKRYRPISKDRLKIKNEPLYLRLKMEGILI